LGCIRSGDSCHVFFSSSGDQNDSKRPDKGHQLVDVSSVLFRRGLWLVYGFMIHAAPVILANLVTLVLSGTILVMKLRKG
jgi:hypothetical protein